MALGDCRKAGGDVEEEAAEEDEAAATGADSMLAGSFSFRLPFNGNMCGKSEERDGVFETGRQRRANEGRRLWAPFSTNFWT